MVKLALCALGRVEGRGPPPHVTAGVVTTPAPSATPKMASDAAAAKVASNAAAAAGVSCNTNTCTHSHSQSMSSGVDNLRIKVL